ncbi:MAG: hypothetical protein R2748_29730 [Bryobacterales bacterium]
MRTATSSSFWSAIGVGISLSLLTVGVSTLEEFAGKPEAYQRFGFLLLAFASTLAYLMCAFLALWAVAALIGLKLPRWQAALTLAGFLPLCFYTLLLPSADAYPLPVPWVDGTTRTLFLSACVFGVALLFALRPANVYPVWSKALRLTAPAALLTSVFVFGLWPMLYGGDVQSWFFEALAITAFVLSFRPGDGWSTAGVAGSFCSSESEERPASRAKRCSSRCSAAESAPQALRTSF